MNSNLTEGSEIVPTLINQSQQKSAKIAGAMLLFLILLYFAEQLITSQIGAATAKKIIALY